MPNQIKYVAGVFAAGCAVALAGVIWLGFHIQQPTGDVTAEVFGGPEMRSAFADAETATVQRLRPRRDSLENPRKLESYEHGPATRVPAETIRELKMLFQRADSFGWNTVKSCAPDYGVLFTFSAPSRKVQLALCLQCDVFGVYDKAGSEVNTEEDFDPLTAKLISLIQPLFPGDQEIQNLK